MKKPSTFKTSFRPLTLVTPVPSWRLDVGRSKFALPRCNPATLLTVLTLVTLAAIGCSVPTALLGGHAITVPSATGVHQTLVQGENPSAATRQSQETIKMRTYTLPTGSRIESSVTGEAPPSAPPSP